MAPKRTTRANSVPCTLVHTKSGHSITVPESGNFTIGSASENSAVIDLPYISLRHSLIKFVDGQFLISDLDSNFGTFLNHEKLEGGKRMCKELNHGDLISFGNTSEGADCVYKFSYPPCLEKKHVSDMKKLQHASLKLINNRKNYKKTLTILHSKISSIKTEHSALNQSIKSQMAEFGKLINKTQLQTSIFDRKRRTELSSLESLVVNNDTEEFRRKITDIVENELQCHICSETLINARVANCNHTFCENCFIHWVVKDSTCPVCRKCVQFSSTCLVLDNFISSYYDCIGGESKATRDVVVQLRKAEKPTSRKKIANLNASRVLLNNVNGDDNSLVIDLTDRC